MGLADGRTVRALPQGDAPSSGAAGGTHAHDPIGDDYRFEGLWDDLPKERMREGVALLMAHYGPEDTKRFIDTMTRARMKQLAFNGTDSALHLAQEYAPQVVEAARQVRTWAKQNPVVLGGMVGSVASAAFSYVAHKRAVGGG